MKPVAVPGAVVEEWLHGHVLVAARYDDVGLSGKDLCRSRPDRLESTAAQPIDVERGRGHGEARRQGRSPGVEGVWAHLAHAAHHDLSYLVIAHPASHQGLANRRGTQFVGRCVAE